MVHPVWTQTLYYMIVLILAFCMIGFIQRGFFWKYIKVRLSFGRLVVVKIRGITRDFYAVGDIQENFLVFKAHKEKKRINIKDSNVFYRSLGCIWVDLDEHKNALSKTDYTPIDGFDAIKYEHLYERTLYKPAIADNKEKIMFACLIGIAIGIVVVAFLVFKNAEAIQMVYQQIGSIKVDSALVVGGSTP